MRMPAEGSRPLSTSQNIRFVLTPRPSGAGHDISGTSTTGGVSGTALRLAAGGAAVVRLCCPSAVPAGTAELNNSAMTKRIPVSIAADRSDDRQVACERARHREREPRGDRLVVDARQT